MLVVIASNVLAVALAFRATLLRTKDQLWPSFLVIFLLLALRYNYGNDYGAYLAQFHSLDSNDPSVRHEVGWRFLSSLFRPLGFFSLVAVLAAFNCWVVLRFIRANVQQEYFGLAVFIYVFNPYFLLVHSSAMRQTVAINLFLLSITYLQERSALRYLICAGLASLFHTSAQVLLPVYAMVWISRSKSNVRVLLLAGMYVLAIAYAGELRAYVPALVADFADRYDVYQEFSDLGVGPGVVFYTAIFLMILLLEKYQTADKSVLFRIAILSFFATVPLGLINNMASRVGMYFSPVLIAVIPAMAASLKDKNLRAGFVLAYCAVTIYEFYVFFQSEVWGTQFGTYRSILSAPGWM